jgi:histidinol-phosphatase (PHP family)
MLPADNHVHTQFSYDTGPQASMVRACEKAIAMGLPAIAFTEHLDYSDWIVGDQVADELDRLPPYRQHRKSLDIEGYQRSIAACRDRFSELRILSGVEVGEPHLFAASIENTLKQGTFDRILGSLHAVVQGRSIVGVGEMFYDSNADEVARRYFTEMLRLVAGSSVFQVLAHVDFPRRYWPSNAAPYDEHRFEEEYRAVFTELASSGRALEINTRSPMASVELIRWWHEAGGEAVSFGSDAHTPGRVGELFDVAVDVVESAGFKPGRDRFDFWRR